MTASKQSKNIRIGKTSDAELNEMAEESYRQITRGHSSQPVPELLDGTPNDVLEREYKKGFFAGKEAGAKAERERVLEEAEDLREAYQNGYTDGQAKAAIENDRNNTNRTKAERERVLDSVVIRCHFLIPPDILDEPHHRIERATLEKVFKEIKSLRGGDRR